MGKDLNGDELGKGLSQRSDKRYQARYVNRFGHRKTFYSYDLNKLKRELSEYIHEDINDESLLNDKITLNELYEQLMEIKKPTIREGTFNNYHFSYKRIANVLGDRVAKDIKLSEFQRVFNNMPSDGSRKQSKIILKQVFDFGVDEEMLKSSRIVSKIKTRLISSSHEKRILTLKEQEWFIEECKSKIDWEFFEFILNTGLRFGEAAGLQWKYVDFDNNVIYIKEGLTNNRDNKAKKYVSKLGKLKTAASERKIPLTKRAKEILISRKELGRVGTQEFVDIVFINKNNNVFVDRNKISTLKSILKRIKKKHEEFNPDGITIHSLRHTFATRCIEQGIDYSTVQKLLGHAKANTTLNIYCHTTDDNIKEAINIMNNILK